MRKLTLFLFFTCQLLAGLAQAGSPERITYQGTLRRAGAIYTGTVPMEFSITNANGSVIYWTSGSTNVYVSAGLFRYPLGTPNEAQFAAIPWASASPYVRVVVDGAALPADPLFSAPYALHAKTTEGIAGTFTLTDGDVRITTTTGNRGIIFQDGSMQYTAAASGLWTTSGVNIYNSNSGNVGIGLSNPSQKLEVSGTVKATAFEGDGSGLTGITGLGGGGDSLGTHIATQTLNMSGFGIVAVSTIGVSSITATGSVIAARFIGDGAGLTALSVSAASIGSGTLPGTVIASSVAVNGIYDDAIVSMSASKLTGALPAISGAALTDVGGIDNLGNHVATTTLNMSGFDIVAASTITVSSITTTGAGVVFSTSMFVTRGNVGIGTTSPTAKLHIGGTPGVDGIRFPDGTLMTSAAAGSASNLANAADAVVNADSDANASGAVRLQTAAADRLYISNSGNVAIGNTSPTYKLEVKGSGTENFQVNPQAGYISLLINGVEAARIEP